MRPGAILVSFFLAATAAAGVGNSTLTAQTQVHANCSVSTTAVSFGNYDPIVAHKTTDLNAIGAVTIACVKDTAPTIALGLGNNASGSTRRMRDTPSGDFLSYELYQPPNTTPAAACTFPGTTVWGSAGANLFSATAATDKTARTYNICATIFSGQNPSVGSYSDTVVVTVSF